MSTVFFVHLEPETFIEICFAPLLIIQKYGEISEIGFVQIQMYSTMQTALRNYTIFPCHI